MNHPNHPNPALTTEFFLLLFFKADHDVHVETQSENQAIFGPEYTNGGAPASLYPGQINAHAVDVTQGYWTSFIRTLDPNTHKVADAVNWDTWTDAGHKRLLIATGGKSSMEVVDDKTRERCEYITSIGVSIKQ